MTWSKRALCAFALGVLMAGVAQAQVAGTPFEISGGAGVFLFDTRAQVQNGPAFNGAFGWRPLPWLTLEAQATFGPSKADTLPEQKHNFSTYGLDLRWNLRPPEERMVPYLLTGMAYGSSHTSGHEPEKLERGAPSIGGGVLLNVIDQHTYLRLQARDLFFRDRDQQGFSSHMAMTVGLQRSFGGKPRDTDIDGVRDWLDRCPATPLGARVDANGCPLDADADSVFDGLDACDDTPRGCTVDDKGCPIDSDGDGVCDGLDQCADTPTGKEVDAKGCPVDADEDGVKTPDDQCEGTPRGCTVDDKGCPIDSDGDGVCDGLDGCPQLGAGYEVDGNGCPAEVLSREQQMLDTGRIRMRAITFAPGAVLPDSAGVAALDIAGAVLARWPALQIEIAGHSDSRERGGQALSQARADTVRTLILARFPALQADSISAVGFGGDRPVTSNATEEGRSRNRRIEFTVKNRQMIIDELKRRRLLEQVDEGSGK